MTKFLHISSIKSDIHVCHHEYHVSAIMREEKVSIELYGVREQIQTQYVQ